jgi:23S rRNA pseudouridine1911/1915/1917 synthase
MKTHLPILYEDNHLLILNKPNGLLTQPSGTEQDSLELQAKSWLKNIYQKPGDVFLQSVHRLDKPVSGIVVFCKTSKSLKRLNEDMRSKRFKKIYWAWIEGKKYPLNGVLEHYLIHDDFSARVVSSRDPSSKQARLTYRTLQSQQDRSLVEIELETGRYHQIRAQFAAEGFPLWGDVKYGSHQNLGGFIALHHRHLEVFHPISKLLLAIEAPCPLFFLI